MTKFSDPAVAAAFDAFAPATRVGALALRDLVLATAQGVPQAQPLQEALRWGQPAYLAPRGSTIRVGGHKSAPFALFVHCQSRLIGDFTLAFPDEDRLDGTRRRPVRRSRPDRPCPARLAYRTGADLSPLTAFAFDLAFDLVLLAPGAHGLAAGRAAA